MTTTPETPAGFVRLTLQTKPPPGVASSPRRFGFHADTFGYVEGFDGGGGSVVYLRSPSGPERLEVRETVDEVLVAVAGARQPAETPNPLAFAWGIERQAGHTTRCIEATLHVGATLIVDEAVIARDLARKHPGLRVVSRAEVARWGVAGPVIVDPSVLQRLAGPLPPGREWRRADPKWTSLPSESVEHAGLALLHQGEAVLPRGPGRRDDRLDRTITLTRAAGYKFSVRVGDVAEVVEPSDGLREQGIGSVLRFPDGVEHYAREPVEQVRAALGASATQKVGAEALGCDGCAHDRGASCALIAGRLAPESDAGRAWLWVQYSAGLDCRTPRPGAPGCPARTPVADAGLRVDGVDATHGEVKQETCTRCGESYPAPVGLHHTEEECKEAIADLIDQRLAQGNAAHRLHSLDAQLTEAEHGERDRATCGRGPYVAALAASLPATLAALRESFATERTRLEAIVRGDPEAVAAAVAELRAKRGAA